MSPPNQPDWNHPGTGANPPTGGFGPLRPGWRPPAAAVWIAILAGGAITVTMANFQLGRNAAPAAPPAELETLRAENEQLRRQSEELLAAAAGRPPASEKPAAESGHAADRRESGAKVGPAAAAKWTLLFRGDDPSLWDTDYDAGDTYAVPLRFAPADMRYLRLCRLDNDDVLIIPLRCGQLRNSLPPTAEQPIRWNGTGRKEWEGRHLGIAETPRYPFPAPNGMISVLNDGWDAFAGSGFGHKCFANDTQYYCWRGREIPRTAFEIAVSPGPLTPAEEQCVLTAP